MAVSSHPVATRTSSVSTAGVLLAGVAVFALSLALPWLRQDLGWLEVVAVAAALLAAGAMRGWRGEAAVLCSAALALSIAFHWAPKVLAESMQTGYEVGLLFTIPIVFWDAARLAIPFWCAGRLVRDPRNAWLPAGLAAVATEALIPGVFPWKLGYSQIGWPVMIQGADLFGPEWPTFALFALAGLLVAVAAPIVARFRGEPATSPVTAGGVAALVVTAANVGYGVWALGHYDAVASSAAKAAVALVQVDPSHDDSLADLQRLTRAACAARPTPFDVVCWPECAGGSYEECLASFSDPDLILKHSRDPGRGLRPLENPACPLLFGGKIYRGYPERPRELYQSALLIDCRETMIGRYDKRHLMPFGEYVPGGDHFPQLRHYFPMENEFDVGREATVLPCDDRVKLGVMLCYEDMVPEAARSLAVNSANLLVSLINGAAFTEPLTLVQHRLLAQLRAVECRRAFVRCAATGETCVIAPTGRIVARLPLHVRDVLTAEVPLLEGVTVASRLGPAFPLACAAGVGLLALGGRRWRS
ncbi:MAG: apolipoprotein N-acyltransferase [Planctomycetia bacterium]|nr:apolipoprotein N-acyltransferase [Planctomycetia bacterium]